MFYFYDVVVRIVYEGVGCFFLEFSIKRMSRLVGDKFVFMEDVVVICFGWVVVMCRFVWEKVDLLRVCVKVLIFESF